MDSIYALTIVEYHNLSKKRYICAGISPRGSSLDQESSIISLSAPVASVSTDHSRYDSPLEEKGLKFADSNSSSRKVGRGKTIQSPRSASSYRRSARLKVTYLNIINYSINGCSYVSS